MKKNFKYEYGVHAFHDELVFEKQCHVLEQGLPDIQKGARLTDVDGSQIQVYTLDGSAISVQNDVALGVMVMSEVAIDACFGDEVKRTDLVPG